MPENLILCLRLSSLPWLPVQPPYSLTRGLSTQPLHPKHPMVSRNSQHRLSTWLLRTSCCWKTDCWGKKNCDLRRERRMGGTHPSWACPCSSPDRSPAVMGTNPQPLTARSIPAVAPTVILSMGISQDQEQFSSLGGLAVNSVGSLFTSPRSKQGFDSDQAAALYTPTHGFCGCAKSTNKQTLRGFSAAS